MISIVVHVVVLGSLLGYGLWRVDELAAPSVEVKMLRPDKLPAGVAAPKPESPVPRHDPRNDQ